MGLARRRLGGQARIDKQNEKPEETPAPAKKTAPTAKRPPGRPRKTT